MNARKLFSYLMAVLVYVFAFTAQAGYDAKVTGVWVSNPHPLVGEPITLNCEFKNLSTADSGYSGNATFCIRMIVNNKKVREIKGYENGAELGFNEVKKFSEKSYIPESATIHKFSCEIMDYNCSVFFDENFTRFTPREDPCSTIYCGGTVTGSWEYYCSGDKVKKKRQNCSTYCDPSGPSCKMDYNNCSWERKTAETCAYGCSNGSCKSDPCIGVACDDYCSGNIAHRWRSCSNGSCDSGTSIDCDSMDTPKHCSNTCNGDDLLKTCTWTDYSCDQSIGRCDAGKTRTTTSSGQTCAWGCQNGACRPNPCAGLNCVSFCDGNVAHKINGCSGGQCNEVSVIDCDNMDTWPNCYQTCKGNELIEECSWTDYSCGNGRCDSGTPRKSRRTVEICSDGCDGVACRKCDSHDHRACDGNVLAWYDSCGRREETVENCANRSAVCTADNGGGYYSGGFCDPTKNDCYYADFTACEYGCESGKCKEDPCMGVDCGEDSWSEWSANYCDGQSLEHKRTFFKHFCDAGTCLRHEVDTQTETVKTCDWACVDGINDLEAACAKQPCQIKDIHWSDEISYNGQKIEMIIDTMGACDGQTANISIYKKGDSLLADVLHFNQPIILTDGTNSIIWATPYFALALDGSQKWYKTEDKYYFVVDYNGKKNKSNILKVDPVIEKLGQLVNLFEIYEVEDPECDDDGADTISAKCSDIHREKDEWNGYWTKVSIMDTLENLGINGENLTTSIYMSACEGCTVETGAILFACFSLGEESFGIMCIPAGFCYLVCGGAVAEKIIPLVISPLRELFMNIMESKVTKNILSKGFKLISKKITKNGFRLVLENIDTGERGFVEWQFRHDSSGSIFRTPRVVKSIFAYDGGPEMVVFRKKVRYIESLFNLPATAKKFVTGMFKRGFADDYKSMYTKLGENIFSDGSRTSISFNQKFSTDEDFGSFIVKVVNGKRVRRISLSIDVPNLGNYGKEAVIRDMVLPHEMSHEVGFLSLERFYKVETDELGNVFIKGLNLNNGAVDYFDTVATLRSLKGSKLNNFKELTLEYVRRMYDSMYNNGKISATNIGDDYWVLNAYNLANELEDDILASTIKADVGRVSRKGNADWFVSAAKQFHDDAEIYARERLLDKPGNDFFGAIDRWMFDHTSEYYPVTYDSSGGPNDNKNSEGADRYITNHGPGERSVECEGGMTATVRWNRALEYCPSDSTSTSDCYIDYGSENSFECEISYRGEVYCTIKGGCSIDDPCRVLQTNCMDSYNNNQEPGGCSMVSGNSTGSASSFIVLASLFLLALLVVF